MNNSLNLNTLNITKPTLLLDKARALRNIERMARKAKSSNVSFRPHFKTHQSAGVAEWFRDQGVNAITVSSVDMASYFVDNGWNDITIAFPLNIRELDRVAKLAESIRLGVLVDSELAIQALSKSIKTSLHVWFKIDTGYGRAGIKWDNPDIIISLAKQIQKAPNLTLDGILTHNGHAYYANTREDIIAVYDESTSRLNIVREALSTAGIRNIKISTGDTPCCSIVEDFNGVDEIRPGNFVFFDVMQAMKGVCNWDDIAVAVACPVVGKYDDRIQIVIYGGAVHLSKERILEPNGNHIFGYLSSGSDQAFGEPDLNAPVVSLSQEHGIVQLTNESFDHIHIGSIVMVLPIHSCLTCDMYTEYLTLEGERIGRWS